MRASFRTDQSIVWTRVHKVADFVYFSYGIYSAGTSVCGHTANTDSLYTYYAHGDLDTDGTMSTFELAAGTDSGNSIYHSRGLYNANEVE